MALGTVPTNNLEGFKGEDLLFTFVVGADLVSDITGWTLVMTIKNTDDAPTTTVTINCAVTDGPNRLFTVTIPAATMTALVVGAYLYDIWRTNAGFAWTLSVGAFTVKTERRVQTP